MRKIISIGEKVTVNNVFDGMVIEASLKKNSVTYRVQQTNDDGFNTIWAEDWEITSKHHEVSVVRECLISIKKEEVD